MDTAVPFGLGMLFCIVGWAILKLVAAIGEDARIEQYAADLDPDAEAREKAFDESVTEALRIVQPAETVNVPLVRIGNPGTKPNVVALPPRVPKQRGVDQ